MSYIYNSIKDFLKLWGLKDNKMMEEELVELVEQLIEDAYATGFQDGEKEGYDSCCTSYTTGMVKDK